MYKITPTSIADPTTAQIAGFKAYASISESEHDALFSDLLKNAMLEVGDWEDVSLLAQTIRLTVSEREENGPITLYRGGGTITSVTDAAGNAIGYTMHGGAVLPDVFTPEVVITYNTSVSDGDLARLLTRAYRYATAVYDGEDANTLQKILTTR